MRFPIPVSKWTVVILAAFVLMAGGAFVLKRSSDDAADGTRRSADGAAAQAHDGPTVQLGRPELTPKDDSQKTPPAQRNPLAIGMTSPNPLAFVTQMRQQGGPGAYAMAEQVTYQCREALQALQRYTDPAYASLRASQRARNVGREGHAESLQAMSAQKIEARCRPFADDLESDQPKSDDSSAKAYQEAMQLLLDPSKDLATSLKALAEQGQLQSAAVVLRSRYRFRDDELNTPENRDLLARAMTLAAFNASTDQQNQSEDLRLMTSCLYSSVCDGSYASEVLERWPEGSPQRAKAQAVAEQFQRAFETGDYAAFVRKR